MCTPPNHGPDSISGGSFTLIGCRIGQKLRTSHGVILEYCGTIPGEYPHSVRYPNGGLGTRLDDGRVFAKTPRPEDEAVVAVLTEEEAKNVTVRNIEVVVGQKWRDLDSRMNGRVCEVVEVRSGKALLRNASTRSRPRWISIRRMHKHSTGWELCPDLPKASRTAQFQGGSHD